MKLVIPADTLAELADVHVLSNIIRVADGSHTASAASIADSIVDSGYLHAVVAEVAAKVQAETARRAAEILTELGFDAIGDHILSQLAGTPDYVHL